MCHCQVFLKAENSKKMYLFIFKKITWIYYLYKWMTLLAALTGATNIVGVAAE